MREGIAWTVNDSIFVGTFAQTNAEADNDNYCLRIDNRSQGLALDGSLSMNSVIFSCGQNVRGGTLVDENGLDSGITEEQWAINGGNQFQTVANQPNGDMVSPTATANTELQILGGTSGYESLVWATSSVDSAAPVATTTPVNTANDYIGAVGPGNDWTVGWTWGIHAGRRGDSTGDMPLWIEGL